jgi:hypothetical protein
MASNSLIPTTNPSSFSIPITEKFSKTNYLLWCAHLNDLMLGIEKMPTKIVATKDGDSSTEKSNPDYYHWVTRDQTLLGYLFSSLMCEVLKGVTTHTSSVAVWSALEEMYTSHTRAGSVNTCIALTTTRKGASTMADYFNKMKRHTNEMAATGQSLGDKEFVAYILMGLDEEIYNSFVSSIVTRVEPITPSELYSQILSFELHLDKQSGGTGGYSSANAATPRLNSGLPSDAGNSRPRCQVCYKVGAYCR